MLKPNLLTIHSSESSKTNTRGKAVFYAELQPFSVVPSIIASLVQGIILLTLLGTLTNDLGAFMIELHYQEIVR